MTNIGDDYTVNFEKYQQEQDPNRCVCIYLGRCGSRPSALANPYKLKMHTRDDACNKYADWLEAKLDERGEEYQEIMRIFELCNQYEEVHLCCHCHPERCHADAVKDTLEKLLCRSTNSSPPSATDPEVRYTTQSVFARKESSTYNSAQQP